MVQTQIDFGTEELTETGLSLVALRAQQLREAQRAVVEAEEALKAKKASLDELETKLLPEAMSALGITKLTLGTGETIDVKDEYHCAIPAAQQAAAFAWLREHEQDSLIKRLVTLSFGKGEDDIAEEVTKVLEENFEGIALEQKQFVHPQTLKAFVKEVIEEENSVTEELSEAERLPRELFGVHIINRARITQRKK